jgi:hypothetical protein
MKLMQQKNEQVSCVQHAKLATLANVVADLAFSIPVRTIQNANSQSKPNPPAPSAKNAVA